MNSIPHFADWALSYKIMFKCMSGFTTDNGKFIMPLHEKLPYYSSVDRCDSFGFKNHSSMSIRYRIERDRGGYSIPDKSVLFGHLLTN